MAGSLGRPIAGWAPKFSAAVARGAMVKKRELNPESVWDAAAVAAAFEGAGVKPQHVARLHG